MTRRAVTIIVTTLAAAAVIAPSAEDRPPFVIWNASESVPIGFYWVQPSGKLRVTDLVVARLPAPLASMLAERGYLPNGVPLIKRVLALPGQTVCRQNLAITVDAIAMGESRESDRRGRPLPIWQGCQVIAAGKVFVMNWDEPESFDGRYFGPIPIAAIIGRALPLWTFGQD
jgi:conjugative transfer signal peptidase TraF